MRESLGEGMGKTVVGRADIVALDNERVFLSFQRERTGTVWPLFPRYCRSTGSSKRST